MSTETFREIDLGSMLMGRILNKQTNTSSTPTGGFDPHKLLVRKNREETTGEIDPSTIVRWNEDDVKELEEYCRKLNIVGFNCGKMSPKAALMMLKSKMGDISPTNSETVKSTKQIIYG